MQRQPLNRERKKVKQYNNNIYFSDGRRIKGRLKEN